MEGQQNYQDKYEKRQGVTLLHAIQCEYADEGNAHYSISVNTSYCQSIDY
jgi:hypothetical protein